jgi:predicted DNA-binding transcriptional regulator YafY
VRADRLLSLMLLLQSKGRMTAQELADELEVSERTVYRDIDALSAAGVPIYAQPGTSGGVFLDEHYRISLTGLSKAEVLSLFVGSAAGPLADLGLAKAQDETLLKLFAALPSMHRQEAEQARQRFYIDPANWFQIVETPSIFPTIQQAVWEDRQLRITYQPVEGVITERILDAYALVAKANIWYLVGRKPDGEMRNYRIGRISQVESLEAWFERDPDFELAAYWKDSCHIFEKTSTERFPPYSVIVRVAPETFWYFPGYMEGRYAKIDSPDSQGWFKLRVVFDAFGDARMRVLGLGTGIEVLEPVELREAVIGTAQAIVDFHNQLSSSGQEHDR